MAGKTRLGGSAVSRGDLGLQFGAVVLIVAVWESLSRSGLFFQDVIPSILAIIEAFVRVLGNPAFYRNLGVTAYELALAVVIGCSAGTVIGMVLGSSRFMGDAFERYFYYLGTTPKIVFFPVLIMWFGIGSGSKIAMGTLACLLPTVLSVASGMRGVDKTLIKVGRSFNAGTFDMATKVYLPAISHPLMNGVRLGVAYSVVSILLAETKLSNMGLGFMISDYYVRFDMPSMYAVLIIIFILAALLDIVFLKIMRSNERSAAAL